MINGILNIKGDLRLNTIAGKVRFVGPNCTYTTIDAAINASSAGDTILVAPGTYTETITYDVDNLTIKAIGSYFNTLIIQTAANVVDFSTREGCVLEGFTVTVSAATNATHSAIICANDTSNNTSNKVRNCIINGSTASSIDYQTIKKTDGDMDFENCTINYTVTATAGDWGTGALYSITGGGILNFRNCLIQCTTSGNTVAGHGYGILNISANDTVNIWDSKFTFTSANVTTSTIAGVWLQTSGAVANIYNSYINITCSSTASTNCLTIASGCTVNSYSNNYYSLNTDSDQRWANVTGTLNSYGDNVVSGTTTGGGSINLYNTLPVSSTGFQCVSSGTTGGSGSANAGKNYVNVVINGTTRKLFYDTAA